MKSDLTVLPGYIPNECQLGESELSECLNMKQFNFSSVTLSNMFGQISFSLSSFMCHFWVDPRLSGFFQLLENLTHSHPIQSLCFMSNLRLIFVPSELMRIQLEGLREGKSYGLIFPFLPFLSWFPLVCL